MLDWNGILIGAIMVALNAFAYWSDKQLPAPQKPRPRKTEMPTFCAWCVYRVGNECANPQSPVHGRKCGLVCIGWMRCREANASHPQ